MTRWIHPNLNERALLAALVLLIGVSAPARADDVRIVTGEVSPEELAEMLFTERPRTRSLQFTAPPTVAFMVQFGFDSAEILPESRPQLDALGNMLKIEKISDKSLRIEGHTDSIGSAAYNQMLSERRARAVARYLSNAHGVAESRLITTGKGEGKPLDGKDPSDAMNRRVQFQSAE